MANETLITDLVSQQALDQLRDLDTKMESTLNQFKTCATELAKGLKIPVEVSGDLERLKELSNTVMRQAAQATQQYTQQLQQQQQVVANTSNTISRQLMEQEKLNKANREAFQQNQQALDIADRILGSREQNYRLMAKYTEELKRNKEMQKEVTKMEQSGMLTTEQATQRRAALMAEYDRTKFAMQDLSRTLAVETKEMNAAEGSYQQLSQQLERLKQAQKQLNEQEKAGAEGKMLEKEIQNLDARLKDLAADMGEFQRNVGNYAIASTSVKSELKELTNTIVELTMQYEGMTDAEKKSAVGEELKNKIMELTEQASKYKDALGDVKESIAKGASDTRMFDTFIESGKLMASTFGLCSSAAKALGISNDTLEQSMLKVQATMQAVQALTVIQNSLQKQSNIMKGIAILQSKASAAAARIEAAATAQATGATKAQTVAQAAFNVVAKANPYVLLATAILTVIGLIVGYTAATKDATEADEEAKRAADARKESMDNMAQSFGNTAGEMLAKLKLMREQWNALGDDLEGKKQYIKDRQADFDSLAEAAEGAGSKVGSVTDAEKIINDNTGAVEKAIQRRAKAMAGYAEYIRLTQLELQELEKLSTFKYKLYKNRESVDEGTVADLRKYGLTDQDYYYDDGIDPITGQRLSRGSYTVRNSGAFNAASRRMGNQQALDDIKAVRERYEQMRKVAWDEAVKNGITEPANFRGGGSTPSTSNKSGSNSNKEKVKTAEEIQQELDKILLDGYKAASEMEEKYSDEWVAAEKDRIAQEQEISIKAAEKRRDDMIKEINASNMTAEEKAAKIIDVENATNDIIDGINKKAADDEKKLYEEVADYKIDLLEKETATKQATLDLQYQNAVKALYDEYTHGLKLAQAEGRDTTELTEAFNKEKLRLDNEYANATVQGQIEALEQEVAVEGLSDEERERLRRELAQAKAQLAQQEAEQEKDATEAAVEADKKAKEERIKNAEEWMQRGAEACEKISGLVSAIYDNQIAKIDELLEAEQEQYDKEVENIENLAERGAITSEEAEIRKREAAAATAKKQEELEKKKKKLEYQKAVMEKANSVSQIAISTALGIMKALAMTPPNPVMAAFVGAMGAIQIATALAQPIKAYAEGTKGRPHPGGLALVGDADKAEVVMYDGKAWITPDSPTLVDLPKGAEVLPDAEKLTLSAVSSVRNGRYGNGPIIINDYHALEARVADNTKAVTKSLNRMSDRLSRQIKRQTFDAYIKSRI